jgi:hypothetical protein
MSTVNNKSGANSLKGNNNTQQSASKASLMIMFNSFEKECYIALNSIANFFELHNMRLGLSEEYGTPLLDDKSFIWTIGVIDDITNMSESKALEIAANEVRDYCFNTIKILTQSDFKQLAAGKILYFSPGDALVKCASNSDKINAFWNWFVENEAVYSNMDYNVARIQDFGVKLRTIDKGICFEFGHATGKEGNYELFISAGGRKKNIPIVEAIVLGAPEIEGWDIVAYKQPKSPEYYVVEDGLRLSSEDVKFKRFKNGDKYDITLFINGYDKSNPTYWNVIFHLLDAQIGEYDVMTKIGVITLKKADSYTNAYPLVKLRECIK